MMNHRSSNHLVTALIAAVATVALLAHQAYSDCMNGRWP